MRLLTSPPRSTTNGWVRYEEMMLSSNVVAESIPTEIASYKQGWHLSSPPIHSAQTTIKHVPGRWQDGRNRGRAFVCRGRRRPAPCDG